MLVDTHKVLRPDYKIPKSLSDFDPHDFIRRVYKFVRDNVKGRVAIPVSGGVDSTVAAFLLHEIIGDELYPFFINDIFRRIIKGREEWEVTAEIFKDFKNFTPIHIGDQFLPLFYGVTNGEKKREIFRQQYTEISNRYIREIGASWVADGTNYLDILETKGEIKLKTQHNVDLPYIVPKIEPLASLSKPHIRRVAKALGLPDEVAFSIPCPGPAQLIRTVGEVNRDKLWVSKIATDATEQMIDQYCEKIWGNKFRYDETTGVRQPFQMFGVALDNCLEKLDDLSEYASSNLKKKVKCYKMKNYATYRRERVKSQEPSYMPIIWLESEDKDRLDFNSVLAIGENIWNNLGYPRVLYQVYDSRRDSGYLAAIRVVTSEDATTAEPMEIDFDYLSSIGEEIVERSNLVIKVAYDIGRKPPATIELE